MSELNVNYYLLPVGANGRSPLPICEAVSPTMRDKSFRTTSLKDHLVLIWNDYKTLSLRPSQNIMNTNINAESLSAQISKQITVVQVANPLTEAEAGNDQTILQNLNFQNRTPEGVSVDDVSWPQKLGVAQQIDSSSQPTQIFAAINHTQNPLAQFSLEDDSENLNVTGVTVVQNHHNHHHNHIVQHSDSLEDDFDNLNATGVTMVQNYNQPIVQHSDSLEDDSENLNVTGVTIVQNHTKRNIVQYSDSAIHNPAEKTICQAIPPLYTNQNQMLIQLEMPKSPRIWHKFRTLGSFWRKIDLKQLQSLFHLGRQPAMEKILEQPSSTSFNYHTHNANAIASGEQPSLEQYQKKLRELDLCRLCFAKELARNGKFRNAIAEAEQISENSYFFKDAQMLIQSWK
jgi:hypothetical protein